MSNDRYAELYLKARRRSDRDSALLPHEDLVPVFREAGFGHVLNDLGDHGEWTVWTPEDRDTPLYAYTPDLAGDTTDERAQLADLLAEAGAGTERFINVLDGQKASFDTGNNRPPDSLEISGNYGVKGGPGGDDGGLWLVDIDVDDYDEAKESNPLVEDLRKGTLGVASAHTDLDRPGHLYVLVRGDPRAIVRDYLNRPVDNPQASFGEIRIEEQYVVGPGSEVLCGCDRCSDPDAPDHFGRYELANDQPPVVWSEAEFRGFLAADPALEPAPENDDTTSGGATTGASRSGSLDDDTGAWVDLAEAADQYVADALQDVRDPDDRSAADAALARSLGPWLNYDESALRDVLDERGTSKWQTRGENYAESVLDYGTSRTVDAYETVPYWAVVEYAVAEGVVAEDELIHRASEDGQPVADPDDHDGETYRALPDAETYNATLNALEAAGVDHGRDRVDTGGRQVELPTPTGEDVTLDPREAWRAASAVAPDDLAGDLAVDHDGDGWACPACGDQVDAVRALALAEGAVADCEETLTSSEYDRLYRRLRDEFDAPLPEYVSARTATEDMDLALGAVEALRGWHVLEGADSTVTDDGPAGEDGLAVLDPSWEDSESGERIVLFASGAFWCREHEQVFDPLRFVALEAGLLDSEDGHLEGQAFLDAYRTARLEYDAPLPALSWNNQDTDGPEHVPVLPSADELVGEGFTTDRGDLEGAREDVEDLYRDVAADTGGDHVLTALPALGKTTSVIKNAAEFPTLYTAGRKELMADAVETAAEFDVSAYVLPVLAEHRPPEGTVVEAASVARAEGKDVLRDPETLLETVGDWADDGEDTDGGGDQGDEFALDGDAFATVAEQREAEQRREHAAPDDEPVDLPRESCAAANGGDDREARAWQLAIHAASELGHTPREIHQHAETLFGEDLPCQRSGDCPYTEAWDRATDPDRPVDLLIGHYTHAHPPGARTYLYRENDRLQSEPRVVAIDEFPDDTYTQRFGEEHLAHATWLARCLRADVADREGLLERVDDCWGDEYLRAWLTGDLGWGDDETAPGPATLALKARRELTDALAAADRLRTRYDDLGPAADPLAALADSWGDDDVLADVHAALRDAADALKDSEDSGDRALADDLREDVRTPLTQYLMHAPDLADDPVAADDHVSGDLAALVERALAAWRDDPVDGGAVLETALTALRGGEDGVEALAAGAADGDAHPAARLLLLAQLAPDDSEDVRTVETAAFDFQLGGEGSRLKCVDLEGARAVLDRNHQGALLHTPPAFDRNSTVGLDATGRAELWSTALLADVETRDIHDTDAGRRAFLRDTMNLQVVQSSPHINSWEGDPHGKDLGSATALVEAVAEEFGGHQLRQDRLSSTSAPGVITTKCVRQVLESDLYAAGAGAVENYGNMTGSNALGEHNVGAVLGCQHFGDTAVEKWAALAGEEVTREGHGHDLNYNSAAANAYLKRMREDRTMQAILRFGRDEEGAVVFAHTAALRDDLPVEADAEVVRAFSPAAKQVAREARHHRDEFTVADIVDDVSVGRRQVRRVLNEFADLGYLKKRDGGVGQAHQYATADDPGSGEVALPELDLAVKTPGQDPLENTNTGYVWVVHGDSTVRTAREALGAVLTSPDAFAADATPAPPG